MKFPSGLSFVNLLGALVNIFFLDYDPRKCAQMHLDRHVNKMCFEYAQLLSSARGIGFEGGYKYPKSVPQHPCAIWTRTSKANYNWLHNLLSELCIEYNHRYGNIHHISKTGILDNLKEPHNGLNRELQFTQPPQCMPDVYKAYNGDTVQAYRDYYKYGKRHDARGHVMHKWTNRKKPDWI